MKKNNTTLLYMNQDVSLHDALKSSYGDAKTRRSLANKGYQYDKKLSNHNEQVWYNPTNKKLLYNVAGTHNFKDWGTDLWLGLGGLRNTNRFKEADKNLKAAKEKYGTNATITGHSLGGSIGQAIKKDDDKLYSLDAGYTLGQKTRNKTGNAHNYRTSGDVVSMFGAGATHMTTLKNPHSTTGFLPADILKSHDVGNIKNENIYI